MQDQRVEGTSLTISPACDAEPDDAGPQPAARRRLLPRSIGGGRPAGWLLTVVTAAVAVGFWVLVTRPLLPGPVGVADPQRGPAGLLALVLTAAAVELVVLRVPVRRQLHELGLHGAIVAVGLLLAPVAALVAALPLGAVLALALVRDAPPAAVLGSAARTALGAVLGSTAYLLVAGGTGPPAARALLAAVGGAALAALVRLLLAVASAAAEGEDQPWPMVVRLSAAALLLALASAGLGASAVVVLAAAGLVPVLLLAVPALLLVVLGLSWSHGRRSAHDLGVVRGMTVTLTRGGGDPCAALLSEAVCALRVGRGELLLAPDGPGRPGRRLLLVQGVGGPTEDGALDDVALAALGPLSAGALSLPRLEPGDLDVLADLDPAVARWLLVRGYPDLVSVPVVVEGVPVGALAVSGRRRSAPRLDGPDLELLGALAEQLGLVLGTARLTERLGTLEASRRELEQQVSSDDLTGLARRPLFVDRVQQALHQRGAAGTVAVLFVDLDGFKGVNDRLGHAAGDAVLVATAARLSSLLRSGDTAARLGGDEFAVLVLGLDGEDRATLVAARVLDALSLPVPVVDGPVAVRASVGVAVARAGDTVEELLHDADVAMYEAKRAGGMRWQVAERDPLPVASDVAARVETVLEGLSRPVLPGALEVHYQPTVALSDNRVVGVEALVRWRHPQLGLLEPSEFVPLAERLGRMAPLGREVLARGLQQVADWDRSGPAGLVLAVNISGGELRDPGLSDAVAKALASAGLPGDRLVLEVGEAALGEVDGLLPVMQRLSAQGVRWALDGFGVGAVPLGRLDQLPLDVVKIPASLLAQPGAASRSGLSAGLVTLARSLGLVVVVEGVEQQEQVARVLDLDCDQAQGFHYGRPQPASAGGPAVRPPRT